MLLLPRLYLTTWRSARPVNRPLFELSGGERTKVELARILTSGANLLLLDEPINHLEIEAQEALEQALRLYPGTAIVVSHDRYFSMPLVRRRHPCAWMARQVVLRAAQGCCRGLVLLSPVCPSRRPWIG
jgi:ATPase subunit of ABC transporter with duplicated ATPase domains